MQENGFMKKLGLISNFITSLTRKLLITIHISPGISRSKGNLTNMKNILLKKSYSKCGGKTSLRPFSKKLKLRISLDQSLKFYTIFFYCMHKLRTIKIY